MCIRDRTTRAYGATLLNAEGEEFTDPLGPRDAVSQAIFDEVEAGRGVETPDGRPAVLLDTTRISEHDADISLPYMLRRYRCLLYTSDAADERSSVDLG